MRYSVTVKPNSKVESVEEASGENGAPEIVVRTHKPAHDGEANKDVTKLLAKYFKTSKSNVTIIKGATSKHKIVEVL